MENDKMFERKRNSIIKVVIILIIIISVNLLTNYPVVNADRWKYQDTVEDIYNITQSSDDAVAVIDNYFDSNDESITLKSNIFSSIIGLRFDGISLPSNSTHEYRVSSAYLSLYSDHYPYYSESEKVTIYFERDNNDIQTFSNYTNLVNRVPSYNSRNWDLDNVHGLDSTTGQWNDSPNINILITGATGFDNNTVCLLLYSDRGVWFRYFRTYDHHVDYAPRLHIISHIYEYEDAPPSGYDDSDFIETYRTFDIWSTESAYFDYRNWDIQEVVGGWIHRENITGIHGHNIDNVGDYILMVRAEGDSIWSNTGHVKIKYINNATSVITPNVIGHALIWFAKDNGSMTVTGAGPDDEALGFTIRMNPDNATDDMFAFTVYSRDNSGVSTGNTRTVSCSESPFYLNITWDFPNKVFDMDVYDDEDMTDLIGNVNRNGNARVKASYNYHYAFNTYAMGGADGSAGFISMMGYEYGEGFIIVDENDVLIDVIDVDTIEEVREWIDNYIGASSEYDKTPWMGDFTLFLVGMVGVAFIPLGFLIFVSSVRDGDIIGGLQTLVIMFFIGIGCIITWLWA